MMNFNPILNMEDPGAYRSELRNVKDESFVKALIKTDIFYKLPGDEKDGEINTERLEELLQFIKNNIRDGTLELSFYSLFAIDPLLTFYPEFITPDPKCTFAKTFGTLNPGVTPTYVMTFCCKTVVEAVKREMHADDISTMQKDQIETVLKKIIPCRKTNPTPPHDEFKQLIKENDALDICSNWFLEADLNITNIKSCERYHIAIPLNVTTVHPVETRYSYIY